MTEPEGDLAIETPPVNKDLHRRLAVDLNQLTWRLLEKPDHTPEEADEMLEAAYASCYHWRQAGTPLEQARGHWLIARVCAVLARPDSALHHARRSLEICEQNGYGDFDLAYAFEGMARAAAAAGQVATCREWRERAQQAGAAIREEEDRKLFLSDLNSGPWFGQE
jgi:hypothetical protein